jgi:hypothetical protein
VDVNASLARLLGTGEQPQTGTDAAIAIAPVQAEIGFTPGSIGRVRISLQNISSAAITRCIAELQISRENVRVLAGYGDYGTLEAGEIDDAAYLVEYGAVQEDHVPFTLRVSYFVGERAAEVTLQGTLPVRTALPSTNGLAAAELERRYPDVTSAEPVQRFILSYGLEGWGEGNDPTYRYLLGREGREFLIVPRDGAGDIVAGSMLGRRIPRDAAVRAAQLHAQSSLGARDTPTVQRVVPAIGPNRTALWNIHLSFLSGPLQRLVIVSVNAASGEVTQAVELSASLA